jgi:hypothetical protein
VTCWERRALLTAWFSAPSEGVSATATLAMAILTSCIFCVA